MFELLQVAERKYSLINSSFALHVELQSFNGTFYVVDWNETFMSDGSFSTVNPFVTTKKFKTLTAAQRTFDKYFN